MLPVRAGLRTKWWIMDNNIVAYYNRFVGALAGTSLNRGLPAYTLNTTNIFTLVRGLTTDITGNCQSHQLCDFLAIQPLGQLNAGVQKAIWGKKRDDETYCADLFYTSPLQAFSAYTN